MAGFYFKDHTSREIIPHLLITIQLTPHKYFSMSGYSLLVSRLNFIKIEVALVEPPPNGLLQMPLFPPQPLILLKAKRVS